MIRIFVLNVCRSGSKSVAEEYGLLHEPDGWVCKEERALCRAKSRLIYGETSHFWKSKLPSLLGAFPEAHYVHLVRDGRDVVRSFLTRPHYSPRGNRPYHTQKLPPHKEGMSRGEKLCWYWRYWNEHIEETVPQATRVRLEDLQLSVHTNKATRKSLWTEKQEQLFRRVCGDLNARYGYGE